MYTAYFWRGGGGGGGGGGGAKLGLALRSVKTEETVSHRQNNKCRGPRRCEATRGLRALLSQRLCRIKSEFRSCVKVGVAALGFSS